MNSIKKERKKNKASRIVASYLEYGYNPPAILQDFPCEISPKIKIEILKLCEENSVESISKKMQIPINLLKEWNREYIKLGREKMLKAHTTKACIMPRYKRVEIIAEVATHGISKIAAKYGFHKRTIKFWEDQIRALGIEKYLSKHKSNSNKNKKFSMEEKMNILEELKNCGKMEISLKYDVTMKTLDSWIGKFNYYGIEGLQTISQEGVQSRSIHPPEFKLDAVQFRKKNGLVATCQKFGTSCSNINNWQKQIDQMGTQEFLDQNKNRKGQKKRVKKREDILKTCGLFLPKSFEQITEEVKEENLNIDQRLEFSEDLDREVSDIGRGNEGNGKEKVNNLEILERNVDIKGEVLEDRNISIISRNSDIDRSLINEKGGFISTYEKSIFDKEETNYSPPKYPDNSVTQGGDIEDQIPPSAVHQINNILLRKRPQISNLHPPFPYLETMKLLFTQVQHVFPPLIYKPFKIELTQMLNKYIHQLNTHSQTMLQIH